MSDRQDLEALKLVTQTAVHDTKNSLAPILGFAQLLLDDDDLLANREIVRHYLEVMRDSANDAVETLTALRSHYSQG